MGGLSWERIARARLHPVQTRVLELLLEEGGALSPVMMAERFDLPLGNVSYHVRALKAMGMLEKVREVPARGAIEHFYWLTKAVVVDGD